MSKTKTILELAREGLGLAGEDPVAQALEDEFLQNVQAIRAKCEEAGIPGGEGYETYMKLVFRTQRAKEASERESRYVLHAKAHFPALAQALEEAVGLLERERNHLSYKEIGEFLLKIGYYKP